MRLILIILLLAFVASQSATSQNRPGMYPEGSIIAGNCLKSGTNVYRVQDAGAPCLTTLSPQQPLAIGSTVVGATAGMCLTVDGAGKLAQTDCLVAQ